MQLQHLKYFLQIAETGSMNKAADQLFVSQPSLSKVISCMEAELNIKIFERNNRGVSLTEDGKKLYMYTKNILNQFDLISKISTEEIPSVISVSVYPNLLSTSLLSQYYSLYQGKNIIFTLRESRINQIAEDVSGLRSEIGVLHINNAQSKEVYRLLDYHNLEFHLVATDTWYAVVGPNNPLFHSSAVNMRQLLNYTVVRPPDDYFSALTTYLIIDGVSLSEFKRAVYLNNGAATINLMKETDIFAFSLWLSRPDYERHGLKVIPIENCDVSVEMGWIKRCKERLSSEAQTFVSLLQKYYGKEKI
ncbi:LysR family transcriptional regulator [Lachnoclostridium edouardi]|uniref:LysR family transcriptional regulator n=1 Tax=Lachnoclostridium edouardi TaxID=1926283 RepID=UPI000C7D90F4|nr:LysR family transcriptional regulator [Lachnoclostridium edouardi]